MKTYPLDHTLRALEKIMDAKGRRIEDIPEYVALCEYLTCLDWGDTDNLPIAHDELLDTYRNLIAKAAPVWIGSEMEFHRHCQPKEEVAP